ncbi:signal recognition particle-docking protein FtsY [Natrialbaceae archaeon A-arb3/5]
MFDSLKEKLGSFRKDAEEAAEENVEEVDEDELEDVEEDEFEERDDRDETSEPDTDAEAREPTDESDSAPAETDGAETSSGAAADDETESVPSVAPGSSVDSDAGTEVESEAGDETDEIGEVEPDEFDETETDEDEGEADEAETNGSTGFGAKARSLVKGKFVIEEEDLEDPLHELEMALLSGDVEMGVAEEILDNLRDELIGETRTFTTSTGAVVEEALADAIYDVISVGQFDFDERIAVEDKPVTIVFTGVNGVGKTTSIAKLSRYFEERGYSVVMANGDTYRAGANEQIQEHADALDTDIITHEQGGDPAAVLYDAVEYAEANDVDVVLGDTAGRLHTDEGLMDQLEKIDRVVDPDMTLFVDEAVAGQDAVNRAREFDDAAEIDGAILTKADADSNGGAAISVAHVTGKPILFLGVGQGYDDIEQFDPDEMVDRLLADDE